MTRTILHLDLDAFFCAVEEQLNPELRGKAFAVGGRPDQRGVVASCSYPARKLGVRSAMPMSQAVKLCPQLIIVPHHFKEYHAASSEVMARLHALTPLVEQISIDEAFLDVTGLSESGATIAHQLQTKILSELGLPCSFGVATNKLVAKIANNVGKDTAKAKKDGPPNAIQVVPPGHEAAFLEPLPIQELWGVGPKTAERLGKLGVKTIGELAKRPEKELGRLFGKLGYELAQRSKGIDDRPIDLNRETKSISREITFVHDENNFENLQRTLRQLSEGVGWRLRKAGLTGTTVKIKVRWADFTTLTRQITMHQPIDQDSEIYEAAAQLLEQVWSVRRPIRLLGVGVSGLTTAGRQLGLWEDITSLKSRQLQDTLDILKDRFGEQIVKRGSDLNHEDEL